MKPLVSVTVITYNSSKTVLETLESIKAQTYQNLELIVSDDCSTDNTVEVCQKWIEENKSRFVRTELLTVEKNTGVAGNLNRAEAACQGEWVKGIAGDDLLMSNCISDFVDYAQQNTSAIVVFADMKVFDASPDLCGQREQEIITYNRLMSAKSAAEQLDMILKGDCPPAPTCFHKNISGDPLFVNDESIPLLEDWPKWIKILKKGIRFDFMKKKVVMYRMGGISNSPVWQSVDMYRNKRKVHFFYIWDESLDNEQMKLQTIDEECEVYNELMSMRKALDSLKKSHSYKIGKMITFPIRMLRHFLK